MASFLTSIRFPFYSSVDESVHVHDFLNSGLPRIKFVIIIDHHNGSISIGGVDQFGDWQFFKNICTKIIVGTFSRMQSGIHGPKPTSPVSGSMFAKLINC